MASSSPAFWHEHPNLGLMEGLNAPSDVVVFRAIPYATIPARFRQSVLKTDLGNTDREFTKRGFACPYIQGQDTVGGGPLPGEPAICPMDEFSCLILQVSAPLGALQSPSKLSNLPVLVYIHGGGFVLGKTDEAHNTAYIVSQSIGDNQPLITVNIQYRLHSLGYLVSSDLIEDAKKHNEPPGNFAVHDQRNALLWIQRFIFGFGGDPANVTVMGESAGGMSICYHMLSYPPPVGSPPLFRRAILMSGAVSPGTAPSPLGAHDKKYEMLLELVGISPFDPERLEKLRQVPVMNLVYASVAGLAAKGENWGPLDHDSVFSELVTWDNFAALIGKCEWVDEIMLGTTGFEGSTMGGLIGELTPATFASMAENQLGKEKAAELMKVYNISVDMDPNLLLTRAMQWVGDIIFDAPAHQLAQELSAGAAGKKKKVYRYFFDVRNPFPGSPFWGQPHHWVDIYFLFRAHQFRYPTQRLKDISDQHAHLFATFANGKVPWKEYVTRSAGGEETVMVADERDGWVERTRAEDERISGRNIERIAGVKGAYSEKSGAYFPPFSVPELAGKQIV